MSSTTIENIDQARNLVAAAIEGRERWGKNYDANSIDGGAEALMDSLIILRKHGEDGSAIVKANQETGAAKGREAKWKHQRDAALESARVSAGELAVVIDEIEDSRLALRVALANVAALSVRSDSVTSE